MYLLWQLKQEKRIPNVPYIIDTPMGINALNIFRENPKWHKLSVEECDKVSKMFLLVSEHKETNEIILDSRPKVVIAASGMITGGRVLSYLEHYIVQPETTIIMVGYQAEGTRGRKMLDGAKEIKFFGKYYPVNAKIVEIGGLSAHGDQNDLVNWLSDLQNKPTKVFLVHGENQPADELRIKIQEKYGFNCKIPLIGQEFEL
ncbi:MBL fold metallo-hydrolase RNA specificity domain-containing protein [Flavobacterium sp. GP15]